MNLQDERFKLLVMSLQARFGRLPTEDEVIDFINGNEEERQAIWNKEVCNHHFVPRKQGRNSQGESVQVLVCRYCKKTEREVREGAHG